MSKLLKETQIRRFMKLASIGNLSEGFVDNLGEQDDLEYNQGSYKEGMGGAYGRDEEHMMEEEDMEMDVEDADGDEMDMEMDAEDDMGDAPDADVESSVMDIISTITDALQQEYPELDIDVSQDGEAGDEPMDDMDDDMGDDMGDEPMDDDMGDEGDEEVEEVLEDVDMVDEDELVAEVLKRVTARLRKTLAENKRRNRR